MEGELLLLAELGFTDVTDELPVHQGGVVGVVDSPGDRHYLKRRLIIARHVLNRARRLNINNAVKNRSYKSDNLSI